VVAAVVDGSVYHHVVVAGVVWMADEDLEQLMNEVHYSLNNKIKLSKIINN